MHFLKDFIYLFLERREWREKERKRKHQCVVASHASPTGDLARNPGMCRGWESNWQPLGLQACAQSTELHQPELNMHFLRTTLNRQWLLTHSRSSIKFTSFLKKILFIFRERRREEEREGETRRCARDTWIGCLLYALDQGPGPKPSHVPWSGIKLKTFSFQDSAHPTEPHPSGKFSSFLCSYLMIEKYTILL